MLERFLLPDHNHIILICILLLAGIGWPIALHLAKRHNNMAYWLMYMCICYMPLIFYKA